MTKLILGLVITAWLVTVDVTGTWSATAETRFPSGKVETHSLTFIFKQSGTALAGSLGPNAEHQFPIANGKALNDTLTFDCKWGNGALLHFLLVAQGDQLQGRAEGDSTQVPANPGPNYANTIYLTLRKAP